ncbi:hypothetical protein P43SY_010562 [Pythium insidiosum]|uniref:G-patch domain-containing protein n=1 Tax=Pythium insidiosum TaxID=114742 RepID=A0AAD5M9P5_PYTIN|nr:hypothetical protein P43SY_010562 [Pythium insidiosum]KAJ0401483.1 hypothetical protein ATCC90586_010460 [Pythium insidiosum]
MTATETTMPAAPAGPAVPLVGKKYMKQLGAMVNENAASAMSAFARKQMEKMGWSEGKGLGKDEQGMKTYVRVKKREESMGIGVEAVKVQEQQNQWWYNVYDKLADKIKIAADSDDEASKKKSKKKDKKKSKKKSKKRARSDSDSDDDSAEDSDKKPAKKFRVPTDEELFAATGGKLFGRRAYGSCVGKLKRDELLVKGKLAASSASASSGDESASVESASEPATEKADKKKKKKKSSKSE